MPSINIVKHSSLNYLFWLIKLSVVLLFATFFLTDTNAYAGEMTMHAIYVGRGDSIVIESNGHYMLVDSGTPEASDTILEYLNNLEIPENKIDYIISTHPDGDHVGGFAAIFDAYEVGQVFYSPCTKALASYFDFINSVKEKGFPFRTLKDNESWTLGDATVEVVYDGSQGSTYNECSMVLRVTCDGKSILLTGDLPSTMETSLMEQGYNFKADILKVGHHGAAASSCAKFLDAVGAKYAVISSNKSDIATLPKDSVLKRLARRFVKTYRTTDDNVIINVKDGVISTKNKENNGFISIKKGTITLSNNVFYANGSQIKPSVTLTVNGVQVPSSNYSVKYSSNTYTGVATVKLTANEAKYVSACSTTFLILPQKEKIYGKISGEKDIELSWTKQSHASGYTFAYTTDKSFLTGKTYITVKDPKEVKRTIKKLEYNTNYYFVIRAYKTNVGYGKWSKILTVKTPKPPKPEKQHIKDYSVKKNKIKIVWDKQTSKHDAGYYVQYSTDKKFKKKVTTIKYKSTEKNYRTLRDLKWKTKYYIRVQGFNEFGTGKWSKVLKAKTEKKK